MSVRAAFQASSLVGRLGLRRIFTATGRGRDVSPDDATRPRRIKRKGLRQNTEKQRHGPPVTGLYRRIAAGPTVCYGDLAAWNLTQSVLKSEGKP